MKISVLGGGAWGTALASAAAARHEVLLWARDAAQIDAMRRQRRNTRYLGETELPPALALDARWDAALAHADGGLLVIATPMAGLRECLQALPADRPALWLCKGFERGTGALGHEIARALGRSAPGGVLSGPSFALEVARGQPTALVAASDSDELCAAAVQAFHCDALRIYTSNDVVGVEVGGAVKNVLAIATGIVDGMAAQSGAGSSVAPGLNARAALITRGLAELTRLGLALGAQATTFMGLSGLGDLVLTATGELSRNRRVGLLLAAGRTLPEVLAELGHVAEGVYSAATVLARARALGVEMPITEAVVEVIEGRVDPRQAMWRLMTRESRAEFQAPPA
ncbi:MAG: NAD(P)H-dependent glycerol-3-phosphate dehydrogenase [Rubrivivax sp.]|nr:NAD(P)H-dependent glycerol-3-phosphate dehydrogenase [Rubrivivax sp.]